MEVAKFQIATAFLAEVVPEEHACFGACETLVYLEKISGQSQIFIPVIEIQNAKHTSLTWNIECSLIQNFYLLCTCIYVYNFVALRNLFLAGVN